MVREQVGHTKYPVTKHQPITFTHRYKQYVQGHHNSQQRLRSLANGFREIMGTTHLLLNHTIAAQPIATTKDKPCTGAQGLRRAYNATTSLHLQGDTLYIAGTIWRHPYTGNVSLPDAWDDLKKAVRIYTLRCKVQNGGRCYDSTS